MLRIPWSVNLNRLMYVAMICLLGEFVCAVCGFARSPNNEHARGGAMRATTHTVGPQATFAAPFVGFRFRPRPCDKSPCWARRSSIERLGAQVLRRFTR